MPPAKTRAERLRRRKRYTVRVVGRARVSRGAKLSLLFALAVGITLALIWRIWRSEANVIPYQRTLPEAVLDWQCGRGHTFRAAGKAEHIPCVRCGRPSLPVAVFECEVHGSFQVQFRLKETETGRVVPEAYRIGKRDWQDASARMHCPSCVRILVRTKRDPLSTRTGP